LTKQYFSPGITKKQLSKDLGSIGFKGKVLIFFPAIKILKI
jgi:hypothetical protein